VTTLEDTVLDLVEATASGRQAVGVIILACQQRLTTPARLLDAASRRKKMRRRALVADVLAEVRSGVQSPLERQYYWQVERAHGLPKGRRNQAEGRRGRRRYRDVRYQGLRTVVELDGRLAHPGEERDRDDIRDNEVAETEGTVTLRYGWAAVADDPCGIAAQVGRVLASRGWSGRIKPCGPQCTASLP
jgi:very-short-patch-repair endonuclease